MPRTRKVQPTPETQPAEVPAHPHFRVRIAQGNLATWHNVDADVIELDGKTVPLSDLADAYRLVTSRGVEDLVGLLNRIRQDGDTYTIADITPEIEVEFAGEIEVGGRTIEVRTKAEVAVDLQRREFGAEPLYLDQSVKDVTHQLELFNRRSRHGG